VCGQMRHERPPPRASVVPPSGRSECAKALLTSPRCPDRPAVASSDQKRPTAMTAREVELLFTSLAFEAGLSLFWAYDVSIEPADVDAYRKNPELTLVSVIGFAGREVS